MSFTAALSLTPLSAVLVFHYETFDLISKRKMRCVKVQEKDGTWDCDGVDHE